MCMWEGVSVWEHAWRWGVGNKAGSAAGRLGVFDRLLLWSRFFCDSVSVTPSGFVLYIFPRGRVLAFIYTKFRGRIHHVMYAIIIGNVLIRRFSSSRWANASHVMGEYIFEKVIWVANKKVEISNFNFKFPKARNIEIIRYYRQPLQGSFSAVSKPHFTSK